jgi:hypothetical protein
MLLQEKSGNPERKAKTFFLLWGNFQDPNLVRDYFLRTENRWKIDRDLDLISMMYFFREAKQGCQIFHGP